MPVEFSVAFEPQANFRFDSIEIAASYDLLSEAKRIIQRFSDTDPVPRGGLYRSRARGEVDHEAPPHRVGIRLESRREWALSKASQG
jgi:hypothetical protein